MSERRYLPTLSELIDRLSIAQLKEVFITEHKGEYAQEIRDILHDIDLTLEEDDVKSAIMGESGEDILLSPAARKLFPFSTECKNQEKLNIWSSLEQAETNSGNHIPIVIFKRNRSKTFVALEFEKLLELLNE